MPVTSKIKKFIVFGKPDIGEEEMSAVMDVLRSGWMGTGKVARQIEIEFEEFMGGGHAVAVSSCTIGLTIALKSLGLSYGDNVLTSPITFCSTVNAIIQAGGRPLFGEVKEDGNLDESKFRGNHKVGNLWLSPHFLLPVNYCGKSANIKDSKIPVIEDAAHSFGGQCGYGDVTVFSLYPTKNITAGEGGIIWTRNKDLAKDMKLLSNHGQTSGAWSRYNSGPINNYYVAKPGFKGNMPDILAAIGLVQLRRWKEMEDNRKEVWDIYEKAFGEKGQGHSRHLYTIRVRDRHKVREILYGRGIGTGVHYEALHLQPAYSYLGYKKGDFPVAEKIGEEVLSLPVSNSMTKEDALYVVSCVKEIINKGIKNG